MEALSTTQSTKKVAAIISHYGFVIPMTILMSGIAILTPLICSMGNYVGIFQMIVVGLIGFWWAFRDDYLARNQKKNRGRLYFRNFLIPYMAIIAGNFAIIAIIVSCHLY